MYIEMVEKALDRYVSPQRCSDDHVLEAMRYSVLGGGKRIRALLVLNFNRILGGAANDAMEFAAAIEMMHAYSLIHDDLPCMDDDDPPGEALLPCGVRRGHCAAGRRCPADPCL